MYKVLFNYKDYEHQDHATLSGHNYSNANFLHVKPIHCFIKTCEIEQTLTALAKSSMGNGKPWALESHEHNLTIYSSRKDISAPAPGMW